MTTEPTLRNPGVRVPPPLLFAAGLLLGALLHRLGVPLSLPWIGPEAAARAGLALVLAGGGLVVWGMLTFRRARTAILPTRPASQLVDGGPYRFTRNPMYTGLTTAYVGAAALLDSVWPLLLLPLVLAALVRLVVRREEAYLRGAFGAEYAAYQARVRRWL
jgi:protein-S-isoprenylcysteine O-methyltransferase Ste14